jgi:hypothetical protein
LCLVISGSFNSLYSWWLYFFLHVPLSCTIQKMHLKLFIQTGLMIFHLPWIAPRSQRHILILVSQVSCASAI